jgi:hypothetical protein
LFPQTRVRRPRTLWVQRFSLNAWLLDRCVAYAKAHKHPELAGCTIWQAFEAERPQLVPIRGPFDGFHATQASVSKTCLVRFDNNKYSVASRAVGRPVEIQAYADRIMIRQDGAIVGEHRRRFGRGATIYDPGITCRCLPESPAHCATEPPSRFGYCRVQQLHAERLEAHSAGAAMGDRGMGVVHRRRGSTLVLTRIS